MKTLFISLVLIFSFNTHAAVDERENASEGDEIIQAGRKVKLKKGEKKIRHPLSKKGLTRITKDRKYIYEVEESPRVGTTTVLFSTWDPPNLANATNNITYSTIYEPGFFIMGDYEWPLIDVLGDWTFKVGSGIGLSTGNGVLVDSDGAVRDTAEEGFTLITLPNHASLSYRLKLWDGQPIIPYFEAGAVYYTFLEMRDDNLGPQPGRIAGALGFQIVGGGALDLGFFNRKLVRSMDAEYGINDVFLNIEFRNVTGLNEDLDISSQLVSFGFMIAY